MVTVVSEIRMYFQKFKIVVAKQEIRDVKDTHMNYRCRRSIKYENNILMDTYFFIYHNFPLLFFIEVNLSIKAAKDLHKMLTFFNFSMFASV